MALRVPNAPARFVGRADAARRVRELLRRGPLAVIAGEAGLGKSALAAWLLHGQLADRARDAVMVSLRAGDPHEEPALVVARALARAAGARDLAWSDVLGNADALGAMAIDLAGERWVLLEDLCCAGAEDVARLLRQIVRYARGSKWIAVVRAAPALEDLAGAVVQLGPLPEAEVRLLARSLDPGIGAAALAGIVEQAAGSPLAVRRLLVGMPAQSSPPAALPQEDAALLGALALLSIPLPDAVLARIAGAREGALDALERAGLVERTAEGVWLPERARPHVAAMATMPAAAQKAWCAEAASALCASAEPAWQAEGIRLWLAAGRAEEAGRALEAVGPNLLATGYTARLQRLLEEAPRASLDAWRLRAAAELGDAAVLQSVRPPSDGSAEADYQWARLLQAKRQLDEAKALSARAHAKAKEAGDAGLAFRAELLHAQCLCNLSANVEALALLDRLQAPDARSAVERDSLAAMAMKGAGMHEPALERANRAWQDLAQVPWPERGAVGYRLACVLYLGGELRRAWQMFDGLLADPGCSIRLHSGRTVRYARAGLMVDAGQLEEALAALMELSPYVTRASLLGVHVDIASAIAHVAEGALEQADRLIEEVGARGPAPHLRDVIEALAARMEALRRSACAAVSARESAAEAAPGSAAGEQGNGATSAARAAGEQGSAAGEPVFGEEFAIARASLLLRAGRLSWEEALAVADLPPSTSELRLAARTLRAEARLVAGEALAAAKDAASTADAAREQGYGIRAAEALQLQGDALLVAKERDAAARCAGALAAMAAAMPSRRFEAAARLLGALSAEAPLDAAALEVLAAQGAAPDVAARARALLGAEAPLDRIDRAVLSAVAARGDRRGPETLRGGGGGEWRPGWGLDEAAQSVWLPSGARVDLSRHPVEWRLLASLLAGGGEATKEELVVRVWGERDYHPLRHDNRLHAAVRKLRRAIEDDPARPSRVVTTEEGYALGGVVRALRR